MRSGGIVLCGGESTRMGAAKLALPFGDETLLSRVVRLLGEAVRPIVVVAAADQPLPPLPHDVHVVRDEEPGRGPLEGLRVGLAALQGQVEAVYATSCDAPLLVPALVLRLVELLAHDSASEIIVPRDGRNHYPLAAAYRTSVLPQVETLLKADRLRLGGLLELCPTHEVPVEELRPFDPELATLLNCNLPADYFAALAQAGLAVDAETRRRFELS